MNSDQIRRLQGERGASLILALVFLVVIGTISAAVLSTTASGLQDRVALDTARDHEYTADAAIETAITRVRNNGGTCSPGDSPMTINQDGTNVTIHVDCNPNPAFITLPDNTIATQNNIVFTACLNSEVVSGACPTSKVIINAQVNFQGTSAPLTTYVQSWSVNR